MGIPWIHVVMIRLSSNLPSNIPSLLPSMGAHYAKAEVFLRQTIELSKVTGRRKLCTGAAVPTATQPDALL
jgi:hypothetical protein